MSLSKVNNASAYAVGLRLTMLQIYLYQYWTVAETQKKGRSAPRPCVDLIIIKFSSNQLLKEHWNFKNYAENAPSNGAIWDKFIE